MDIYVFDNTLTKMKSVISEDECFEATEVREINKAGQLSLSLILAAKDEVNETDLLAIHKKDDEYYLYRVVKKNLMSDRVEVLGLEYGYYSLKYDGYIKDIRPKKEALSDLIPRILSGTSWQKGKIDTKIAPFTGTFYYIKRLDALAEIANKLACEFEFVVTISDNQITSQRVNVLSHLGTHTGKRFEYGINALEVIAESDATSIVTQVIGRGKGEESGNGYGRRIDFSSVEWKKSNGDPVDKPKGKNYVNDPTTNYLLPGKKRALEIVVFEDETDPSKLLDKTYKWLLQNNRPKVQFKAQVTEVEGLSLGDYVNIIRPDLNIRYETRVFKLTRNLLNENFNEVEFGDNIATTPMDKLNSVSNSIGGITGTIQRVEEEIDRVDATGVRIHYGKEEPTQKKKGDIWYKETEDGETILMRWNGESWEEVVSNKVIEEINTTVDQAMKDSSQAKEDALNAINKADQAVRNANLANSNLAKFEDEATGEFVKINGNFNGLQTQVGDLKKSTETSITQLDKLIQLQASQIGPFYPNGNFDDENLTNWYELTWNDIGASVQIQDKTLVLQSTSNAKASAITKDYIEVDGTQPFIIKFQALWAKGGNKANARIYVHEYDENKIEIRNANDLIFSAENYPDNFWAIEKKWVTDKNPKYIRIEWVVWNNPATELKLKNITLSNGVGNLSASVNVALEDVSLAVKKDDVINSVNVSTEGVLIDGKKVHITGRTTIDNAVIKDAMIANLSASKLTAGTIDASKINVININAANIIGNKTQFVESAWNSINSNLRIDSNGLTIKKSNGENLLLSNGSFQFRDRNNREIFGISRFADGAVNLAVNKGEVMSITYQGSVEDYTYSPALSFGGTTGTIKFDSSDVQFQDRGIRFTTMDWGNGRVPSFRDPGNKTGIGLGSSVLYFGDSDGIMTLHDIRTGKLLSLKSGGATAKVANIKVDGGGPWLAITGPDGDSKVIFGGNALYLGDASGLVSLNTILKACKLR